jgi:hypothetical protein
MVVLLVFLNAEFKILKLVVVLFEEEDQVHLVFGDVSLTGEKLLIFFFEFEGSLLNIVETPDGLLDLALDKLKILKYLGIYHVDYLAIGVMHLLNPGELTPDTLQPFQKHRPTRQYDILLLISFNPDFDIQLIQHLSVSILQLSLRQLCHPPLFVPLEPVPAIYDRHL